MKQILMPNNMSNKEKIFDHHSTKSANVSPHSPSIASEAPCNLSSNRLSSAASSRLPTPPQLQRHGPSTNSINNLTSFKREQCGDNFEATNLECSNSSIPPSPTSLSSTVSNKRLPTYAGTPQFPASLSDSSSSNSAQTSLPNGYVLNAPPYQHHHHHSYHHQHSQQHQSSSPLSSPMPHEIANQAQHTLRSEDSYHSHHPSLYDGQLLLHHHHAASAHAHQPLHFHHEVPIGVNPAVPNNVAHHPYIQSPSPHHFHQGGGHHNVHPSHYDPEDYSPGSAGSGGGAVIETSSVSNGTRGGDTFSATGVVGPGITPHVAHFYGTSSMGVISPPSLDTLGLSSGSNILNNGANSGTSNGTGGHHYNSFGQGNNLSNNYHFSPSLSSGIHGTPLSSTTPNTNGGNMKFGSVGGAEKRKNTSTHHHHHLGVNSGGGNGPTSSITNSVQVVIGGSNKKERRRTQSINNAFSSLRDCIPNVPTDTKLSKIKTLRLATSYIDYLMQVLDNPDGAPELNPAAIEGFKADIHKRWNEKTEEQKRRELEEELNNNGGYHRMRARGCSTKTGTRTGWPQHVWALELKQ